MTVLTNKNGLPQPLVDALKADKFKVQGDISVSALIDAPQINILKKKHSWDMEQDVSESLWMLMSQAVNTILDKAHVKDKRKQAFLTVIETIKDESVRFNPTDKEGLHKLANTLLTLMVKFFPETESRYVWENTLHYEYKNKTIYGTFNLYDKVEKRLHEYKVCSVYAYMYPESRRKWTAHNNVVAFMLRNAGFEVNSIDVVAIFKDWSASKLEFSKGDYPTAQFMIIPQQVVDHFKMEKYIHAKMDRHIDALEGRVPECNGEDKWSVNDEWVVRKPGMRNALRKFNKEEEAKEFIRDNKHKYEQELFIQIRPGESKRCATYCPVRDFCPQKIKDDALKEKLEK